MSVRTLFRFYGDFHGSLLGLPASGGPERWPGLIEIGRQANESGELELVLRLSPRDAPDTDPEPAWKAVDNGINAAGIFLFQHESEAGETDVTLPVSSGATFRKKEKGRTTTITSGLSFNKKGDLRIELIVPTALSARAENLMSPRPVVLSLTYSLKTLTKESWPAADETALNGWDSSGSPVAVIVDAGYLHGSAVVSKSDRAKLLEPIRDALVLPGIGRELSGFPAVDIGPEKGSAKLALTIGPNPHDTDGRIRAWLVDFGVKSAGALKPGKAISADATGFRFALPGTEPQPGGDDLFKTDAALLEVHSSLSAAAASNDWTRIMEVRTRLAWRQRDDSAITYVLAAASASMDAVTASLHDTEPDQPQSFLPKFSPALQLTPVPLALYSRHLAEQPTDDLWIVATAGRPLDGFRMSLSDVDLADKGFDKPIEIAAALPSFLTRSSGGRDDVTFRLAHDPQVLASNADPYLFNFRLEPVAETSNRQFLGRLGGISFARLIDQGSPQTQPKSLLHTDGDDSPFYSHLRFGTGALAPKPSTSTDWVKTDVDVNLRLRFEAAAPVGVDVERGDRNGAATPILVNLHEAEGQERVFLLTAREIIGPRRDRRLLATLSDIDLNVVTQNAPSDGAVAGAAGRNGTLSARTTAAATRRGEYVLLGTEPFSVIKVYSEPLSERGDQQTAEVAVYDSDSRRWQLKVTSRTYQYALPPQSIGESADKPRRLEIVDPEPGSADANWPFPRKEVGRAAELRYRNVEFRLTPSAELWVSPSDLERGYFDPEWAARDIFRQQGDFGIGAELAGFRGEFLYGLMVSVDPSREKGPAARARVAEIEALTGRPPGAPRASRIDATYGQRWKSLSTAIARRPERLEIWNRGTAEQKTIASSHFREGASFALRSTALHRPAVALLEHSPVEVPNQPFPGPSSPRLHAKGLSGGALWPIESKNVYESLLREPASTGGHIENIALSPIGGDADQRAEFRNGIVAIISETRNGFIQRQQVEVLGRVGAWWNRAKHVVVYERTVNPSAQFTPEGGIKQRTRRPVLRKVSEYIEFLEPCRTYPDFDDVSPRTVGFLEALKFDKIIPVDSAWSRDVGDYGWMIPLWNPHAAALRPQVYPRPMAGFVSKAEGEGDRANVTQECLNPHNLFFYTDTKTNNADTNSWRATLGIDFTNLPFPKHVGKTLSEVAGPGPDARSQPPAPRLPRGYHQFTWLLAPAAHRTAMNAERAEKPLYAGLETITFTRAARTEVAPPAVLNDFLNAATSVGSPNTTRKYWKKGGEPQGDVGTAFGTIWTHFSDFRKAVEAGDPAQVLQAARQFKTTLGDTNGHTQILDDLVRSSGINDTLKLKSVEDLIGNGKARCEELAGDLIGGIRRKKLLLIEQIRSWHAEYDDALVDDSAFDVDKQRLIVTLTEEIEKALTPLFDEAGKEIASVAASIDGARAIVRELQLAFQRAAQGARTQINEFSQSYDRSKPWSTSRLDEFHNKVADYADRYAHNLQSEMDDARARLIVQTDDLAQQLSDFLARWLKDLVAEKDKLGRNLKGLATLLKDRGAAAAMALGVLTQPPGGGQIDGVIAKLEAIKPKLRRQDHLDAIAVLLSTCDRVKDVARAAQDRLGAFQASVTTNQQNAEALLGAAHRAVEDLSGEADHLVRDANAFILDLVALVDQALLDEAHAALSVVSGFVGNAATKALAEVSTFTKAADLIVVTICLEINARAAVLEEAINGGFELIGDIGKDISDGLSAAAAKLAPANILHEIIVAKVVRPTLFELFKPLPDRINTAPAVADLRSQLNRLAAAFEQGLNELDADATDVMETVQDACAGLATTIKDAQQYLSDAAADLADHVKGELAKQLKQLDDRLAPLLSDAGALMAATQRLEADFRKIANDLTRSHEMAEAYGERVLDAAGNITKGGIMAAPSNVLKLAAAAASVPDLPGLDFARERLGYYYDAVNDLIDTTPAEAWFSRIGDQFKAIGLNFPFEQIGNGLCAPDLSEYGVGRICDSFGALKLRDLWRYSGMPPGARDAIKVTNDFDKKAMRAWVRIDINLPLPGRRSLFAVGPFKLDFVDSRFVGQVMIEASKDSDTVKQTGSATLHTNIDAVVSGQSMVRLDKVAVNYSQDDGLKVEFDPKNIKLNEIFRFIQDTLGSIFPDEVGGLNLIKQNGIPIGIEHEFAMPPIDLMYGTSGVTNIQINNKFQLIAYPEFMIADRFSLSRPDLPFIFSIFILGGTGYIWVETQYRPFSKGGGELLVVVEAAAGASASLGFAFAGIVGSVSISLSAALTYRKLIGSSGGGLGVSLVLVILGNVNIFNIANAYIGLMLRLSYRDSGQVDAYGALTVTIRISRFFKITARANVRYVMRDGQSSTKTVTNVQSSADEDLKKAKKLIAATA